MKIPKIIPILLFLITPVQAEDFQTRINQPGQYERLLRENPRFAAYQDRMYNRRELALAMRYQINSRRPPAVYKISEPSFLANPFWSGIQAGWVYQPPIPVYGRWGVGRWGSGPNIIINNNSSSGY